MAQTYATVHNAHRCTFDGRDHWVAALCINGRFSCKMADVEGFDTEAEARLWAQTELRQRGFDPVIHSR